MSNGHVQLALHVLRQVRLHDKKLVFHGEAIVGDKQSASCSHMHRYLAYVGSPIIVGGSFMI